MTIVREIFDKDVKKQINVFIREPTHMAWRSKLFVASITFDYTPVPQVEFMVNGTKGMIVRNNDA